MLNCKIEIAVEWILALWCLLSDPVFWMLVMWWHFRCTWSCGRRANALQEAASRKRETDWKDGHWTHRLEWNAVSLLRLERCGWMVFKWRTTICVRCKRHINPCEDYFKFSLGQFWILEYSVLFQSIKFWKWSTRNDLWVQQVWWLSSILWRTSFQIL